MEQTEAAADQICEGCGRIVSRREMKFKNSNKKDNTHLLDEKSPGTCFSEQG